MKYEGKLSVFKTYELQPWLMYVLSNALLFKFTIFLFKMLSILNLEWTLFDLTDLQLVPLPTFQVDGRRFGKVLSSFPKHIYILIGLKLTREKIRLLQRKM